MGVGWGGWAPGQWETQSQSPRWAAPKKWHRHLTSDLHTHVHIHTCAPTCITTCARTQPSTHKSRCLKSRVTEKLPLATYLVVMSGGQKIILGFQTRVSIGSTLTLVEREKGSRLLWAQYWLYIDLRLIRSQKYIKCDLIYQNMPVCSTFRPQMGSRKQYSVTSTQRTLCFTVKILRLATLLIFSFGVNPTLHCPSHPWTLDLPVQEIPCLHHKSLFMIPSMVLYHVTCFQISLLSWMFADVQWKNN